MINAIARPKVVKATWIIPRIWRGFWSLFYTDKPEPLEFKEGLTVGWRCSLTFSICPFENLS